MASPTNIPELKLDATIGFNGHIDNGLKVHPDKQHFIYPLGCSIIIEDIKTHKQDCLSGHTNDVSCITVSKSGNYLASGQVTHMGFKADIIIWDYHKRELYARLSLHKVKVQALAFSANDQYLISLGGQDDGSVVVWSILNKDAICGAPSQVMSAGTTFCVCCAPCNDNVFVTGGDGTLRVWELDLKNRKIRPTDVNMGQIKRIVKCIEMKDDGSFVYCGTTTGDIVGINVATKLFQCVGPIKDKRFSCGVRSLALLQTGEFLVGAGDGTVAVVRADNFKRIVGKEAKLNGAVTSIALRGTGHQFFCGTEKSHIYRFNYAEFTFDMLSSCHSTDVLDIVFPYGTNQLFATCGAGEVRVWHTDTCKELVRIQEKNMICNAIDITRDGRQLVSAWNDGKIRAFFPQSGKLMYTINDAHNKGVTALACASACNTIISGGGEGQVRVWNVSKKGNDKKGVYVTKLIQAMKEHKGSVAAIKIRKNDKECVSASTDGTCIIWDLERHVRNQIMFANTLFKCVCYHPEEFQVITSGTDRKIGYWETFDGSLIRELDGSKSGSVNAMDISPDGNLFVTGGDDKIIKVWKYNEGEVTHVGIGHSGNVTKVKICPLGKYIISVSEDGAIMRWRFPE